MFSPKIALIGERAVGLNTGVSLPKSFAPGVGVADPARVGLRSGDLLSYPSPGVRGSLSGDVSTELVPSRKLLRSRIFPFPFWSDCMRLWYWPLINDFSGDRFGGGLVVYALSRARAVRASAAAATVAEVLGFVAGLDEPGFKGNGGGARSGSELSHLKFQKNDFSFKYAT